MGWTALKLAAGTLPLAIAAAQGVAAAAPAPLPTPNSATPGNTHSSHDPLRHHTDGLRSAVGVPNHANGPRPGPAGLPPGNDPLQHAPDGMRPLPDRAYLAPIFPAQLHLPTAVAPVKPIEAPPGTIRAGDVIVPVPTGILTQVQLDQVNRLSAVTEAGISTFGDSIGLDQTRADRLGSAVVGDTLVGASVGWSTIGLPMAAAGGLVGGLTGIIVGIPFLPIGLLIGPIVSAAIGAAASAAPFVLVGAAAGAGVGVGQALLEPPHGQPAAPQPPAFIGHAAAPQPGKHHWATTALTGMRA